MSEACRLNLSFGGFGSLIPAAHFLSPREIIKLKMRPFPLETQRFIVGREDGWCGVSQSQVFQVPPLSSQTLLTLAWGRGCMRQCNPARWERSTALSNRARTACPAQTSSALSAIRGLPRAMEAVVRWQRSCTVGILTLLQSRDACVRA